ncbi:MAG TPA: tetratricopeptide repeat protein [Gemmatimonadales bacterium]|nr:tetratricopeptide repeat protein [Gemmatimonadales bacterium]
MYEQLGQVLRTVHRCGEAVPILAAGLELSPTETILRSRLIECLLATGDTAGARASAAEAVKNGQTEFSATLRRLGPAPSGRSP